MKKKPNIILISMDATRWDHLSCYGYRRNTTPNIDRLASQGVIYQQAICPACWTLPSHASMFTGLYVSQHGTHFDNPVLSRKVVTISEFLKQSGYQTIGFPCNEWLSDAFGFHRGFDTYRFREPWMNQMVQYSKAGSLIVKAYNKLYRSKKGRMSRKVNEWVQQQFQKTYSADTPFYLFVLFSDPHLPYNVYPSTKRYLGGKLPRALKVNQDPHKYIVGKADMKPEEFDLLNGLYDGEISFMDERIGDLLKVISSYVPLEDCMIIITADHGENIGDHGLMAHQYCLYDTLIHVPLIVKYPENADAGTSVPAMVQTNEIVTTILDVIDIPKSSIDSSLQGRSLKPSIVEQSPLAFAVSEEPAPNLRRIKCVYPDSDYSSYDRQLRAIRSEEYKFIWASDGRHELVNLKTDPQEKTNIINDQPEKAREMESTLEQWLASIDTDALSEKTVATCDDAVVHRLKDLGYL
ncbi:MAG: sulfatase-like hydrolase/transferase [Desulfobacteraceae bacterium]|nr:sulfatase [Desulfobacteraceae bacterium]MBC2753934.1 sulfatase-like hydrolase/transferase [Desulfobacteraceae bacterium]